ncbi:MAG: hypothetical protein Q9202_005342 [Teloschistes flavicans]
MLRRVLSQGRKPRVCVVGAGIAGMRCAQVLGEKGIDVTILEARNRTARELGATTMSVPDLAPSVYDRAGRLMAKQEGQQCTGIFWGLIEEAFKYSNKESASIPQHQSLLDFCKIKLHEMDLSEATERQVLDLCYFWGDYIGGNIETQSLKYFFLEETIDEGNLFLASTYNAVLQRITKDTYAKANIQLSTKVVSITSPTSRSNQDSDDSSSVTVTTAQGTSSTYDEVVVTVPLGCLKRNLTTFHPPLPPHLQSAINNISYGALEKVYLTFPTAWWLPNQTQTHAHEPDAETPNTKNQNPFFTQWLAPSYTPNHWPVECLFLSSLPAACAHPTLLFYMHGPLASHITNLTHSLSSDPSSPATTTTTNNINNPLLEALTHFFRPYYSLLPNYRPPSPSPSPQNPITTPNHNHNNSNNNNNCEPIHALATDWTHDELAGWGSYSNFQVPPSPSPSPIPSPFPNPPSRSSPNPPSPSPPNTPTPDPTPTPTTSPHDPISQIHIDDSIRSLRHGAPERRLWFAGEATSPFVALGTVTGAWWSGEGVAGRIAAVYGSENTGEGDRNVGAGQGEGEGVGGNGGKGEGEGEKTAGAKRGGTGLGA